MRKGNDVEGGRKYIAANAERIRTAIAPQIQPRTSSWSRPGSATESLVHARVRRAAARAGPAGRRVDRIAPPFQEARIRKVNALCAVRDIAQNPPFGWVLIDNAKLAPAHPRPSDQRLLRGDQPARSSSRLEHVQPAERPRIRRARSARSAARICARCCSAGGILNYHARELPKLSAVDVFEAVRASLGRQPDHAERFRSRERRLSRARDRGVRAHARRLTRSRFYEEIAEQAKRETGGAAVYLGLYRVPASDDGSATVRILSCAHALPAAISELTAEAEREAGAIQQKAAQHVAALDLGGLERLRPARVSPGGARRAPAAAPKSEPTADAEAPRATASEPTPAAPASEPVRRETASSQPSRGRYERLANAFRAASADSARARIAGELDRRTAVGGRARALLRGERDGARGRGVFPRRAAQRSARRRSPRVGPRAPRAREALAHADPSVARADPPGAARGRGRSVRARRSRRCVADLRARAAPRGLAVNALHRLEARRVRQADAVSRRDRGCAGDATAPRSRSCSADLGAQIDDVAHPDASTLADRRGRRVRGAAGRPPVRYQYLMRRNASLHARGVPRALCSKIHSRFGLVTPGHLGYVQLHVDPRRVAAGRRSRGSRRDGPATASPSCIWSRRTRSWRLLRARASAARRSRTRISSSTARSRSTCARPSTGIPASVSPIERPAAPWNGRSRCVRAAPLRRRASVAARMDSSQVQNS